MRLVLAGAFARVLVGLMLGLPLAIAAGKLLSAQLYGVAWWDAPALTVATGALTLCSLVAADSCKPGGVDLADRCAQDGVAPSEDQTAARRFFRGVRRCPEARQGVPAADISTFGRVA